ncbi:MAG: AAA family ATPase [Myxococcota bacterium]
MKRAVSGSPPPFLRRVAVLPDRLAGRTGYPFHLPLVQQLDWTFDRPVTIVVGDNGTGKSTLLEAVAELAGFAPRGGTRSHVGAATLDERRLEDELAAEGGPVDRLRRIRSEGRLAEVLRAGWLPKVTDGFFFRAETFFDLARYLDEASLNEARPYSGPPPPLHLRKSHAEGFLEFFGGRIGRALRDRRPSLFVFDEPEAALAPSRQLEFLRSIRALERSGRSQVVIATHSPVVMAYPGADLRVITDGRLEPTALEQVRHFSMLDEFFADPHGFVARGLGEEGW